MSCKCPDNKKKWLISLYSAIVFVVIAAPFMYQITGKLTGYLGVVSSRDGCPNWIGLILHAVVFLLIVRGMMALKLPGVDDK